MASVAVHSRLVSADDAIKHVLRDLPRVAASTPPGTVAIRAADARRAGVDVVGVHAWIEARGGYVLVEPSVASRRIGRAEDAIYVVPARARGYDD